MAESETDVAVYRAPPSWARVSQPQIAEAEKLGVPVAFENEIGMRFVLIPAGTFEMGSPQSERWREGDEERRQVVIGSYYISAYEVTNEQFRQFKRDHFSGYLDGLTLNDLRQPVGSVTFDDAMAFAEWLSRTDKERAYLLPTEEQWERAARGGVQARYWWGDNSAQFVTYGNGLDEETCRQFEWDVDSFPGDDGYRVSAPVGKYQPNPYGLYDMLGNVWEWCANVYSGESIETESETGESFGEPRDPRDRRPCRGGSWSSSAGTVRVAARNWNWRTTAVSDGGFRLVSPVPQTTKGGRAGRRKNH